MRYLSGNAPDQIWTLLKLWAKKQAAAAVMPTIEQCAAEVKRVSAQFMGPYRPLKPEVVEFYTLEVAEMVAKLRGETNAQTALYGIPE